MIKIYLERDFLITVGNVSNSLNPSSLYVTQKDDWVDPSLVPIVVGIDC